MSNKTTAKPNHKLLVSVLYFVRKQNWEITRNRISYIRRITSLIIAYSVGIACYGQDELTLLDKMVFSGKITKIGKSKLFFVANGYYNTIYANEVFSIQFEKADNKVYQKYLNLKEGDQKKWLRPVGEYFKTKDFHDSIKVPLLLFSSFAQVDSTQVREIIVEHNKKDFKAKYVSGSYLKNRKQIPTKEKTKEEIDRTRKMVGFIISTTMVVLSVLLNVK